MFHYRRLEAANYRRQMRCGLARRLYSVGGTVLPRWVMLRMLENRSRAAALAELSYYSM